MITPEEIIDMTDLTREEVAAVAEQERVSKICVAAAMADYLMHRADGPRTIRRMIGQDMRDALRAGNLAHARELRDVAALHCDASRVFGPGGLRRLAAAGEKFRTTPGGRRRVARWV